MMTGPQIREARKRLNWSPDLLAKRAHVAVGLVLQAEREEGHALLPPAAARAIQQALEGAGVGWLEATGPRLTSTRGA